MCMCLASSCNHLNTFDCAQVVAEPKSSVEAKDKHDEAKDGAPDTKAPTDMLAKCFTNCSIYSPLRAMTNTFLTSFLCACLSVS